MTRRLKYVGEMDAPSHPKWLLCREWWFSPIYGDTVGAPDSIVARDLDHAFQQARKTWPTADGWRCGGRVNTRNPEYSTKVDRGWVEVVVRSRQST